MTELSGPSEFLDEGAGWQQEEAEEGEADEQVWPGVGGGLAWWVSDYGQCVGGPPGWVAD